MAHTRQAHSTREILQLIRSQGILRARDLAPLDIPRHHLKRLVGEGRLLQSGRGLYVLASAKTTEHHSLAEACTRVPRGVVCLLSALRYHGLTTQNPWEVWLAVTPASRKPKVDHPPLRTVRFSGLAFTEGVERVQIEGVTVRIYSAAKTVADCFKYRNKLGVDVAVQALRDGWAKRKVTAAQITEFARVCRVTRVMRPYLDSLLA